MKQSEEAAVKYITRSDSVTKLDLSIPSLHALQRTDISTVGDLLNLSLEELLNLPYMKVKNAAEIAAALKECKLIETDDKLYGLADHEETEASPRFMDHYGNWYCDIPIEDLGLSKRPLHCLENAGILYLSNLQVLDEAALLGLPGMGSKSALEISKVLENTVLHPAQEPQESLPPENSESTSVRRRILQSIVSKLSPDVGQLYKEVTHLFAEQPLLKLPLSPESELQKALFQLPTVRSAISASVLTKLDRSPYGLALTDLQTILPECLNSLTQLSNLLADMEQEGSIIRRDDTTYERLFPSVIDYVFSLTKAQDRIVLQKRLDGKTLGEIGEEFHLSRQRVQQIVATRLKKAPKLSEDRYALVFQKYNLSESDFLLGFNVPQTTYHYLANLYKRGDQPVSALAADPDVPIEFRKAAERILTKNCVVINGERIPCLRSELGEYILRTAGVEGIVFEEFVQRYQRLLADIGQQDNPKLSITERGYANRLAASHHVLWKYGKKLRYYNIGSYDFTIFFETLDLGQYHNVEYSTLKFFRAYPELMREYDIVDEYELHNLLKKICTPEAFPDMHFRRMPNIEFGEADRDAQVRDILLAMAPVTNVSLAEAYENEYGVLAKTVLANYLKSFEPYYHAGQYSIDVPALPQIMANRLQQLLVSEFYLLSDIRKIYEEEFPKVNPNLLNPFALKSLGYRVYVNYAIADRYPSATAYFRALLTKEDSVNTRMFPKGLSNIVAYTSELYKLKVTREIVEYVPLQYVHIRRLLQAGIDKALMEDYCKKVYAAAGTAYFTIHSLRQSGFSHPLDNWKFDEWFYASVLAEDKKHFVYQRMGKNKLFRCGCTDVRLPDFLKWLLRSREVPEIGIQNLVDALADQYHLYISRYKISEVLKESDLYYDAVEQTIYANATAYLENLEGGGQTTCTNCQQSLEIPMSNVSDDR